MEHFVVKHYVGDAHPSIKGNGFDGLTIGDKRVDAEEFVSWVNAVIDRAAKTSGAGANSTQQAKCKT
jgi:hypothetical protein